MTRLLIRLLLVVAPEPLRREHGDELLAVLHERAAAMQQRAHGAGWIRVRTAALRFAAEEVLGAPARRATRLDPVNSLRGE